MDIVQKILDFISDKTRSVAKRLFVLLLLLGVIVLIDDYFKFSYNFKVNSQIEQISKIEEIVKDNKDSSLVNELKSIERNIIDKRTKGDYLSSLFEGLYDSISLHNKNAAENISANPILHYLTSNVLLIVLFYRLSKGSKKWILTKILWFIVLIGVFLGLAFWVSGLVTAFFIPSTLSIFIKLLLNMLFQAFVGLLFYAVVEFTRKSEKQEVPKNEKEPTVIEKIKETLKNSEKTVKTDTETPKKD